LTGERRLDGAPDIRLGGVKMIFHSAAVSTAGGKGTRAIAGMSLDRSKHTKTKAVPAVASAPASSPVRFNWLWLVLLVAVAAVAFFLQKS
jgi:hypothetical protein